MENQEIADQLERPPTADTHTNWTVKLEKQEDAEQRNAPLTANVHTSGSVKLENRRFDDQLAWPVPARRVCAKQRCLLHFRLPINHSPAGTAVAHSNTLPRNHKIQDRQIQNSHSIARSFATPIPQRRHPRPIATNRLKPLKNKNFRHKKNPQSKRNTTKGVAKLPSNALFFENLFIPQCR